jgi:signal transduction histidine kinase
LAGVVESAIFRIVQESLTNACRYSESKRIHVQLTQIDDRIQVRVQDWGIGFNPNAIQGSHFGLRGVRERARLLDGHAVIDSAPGNGTSITVELPLLQATSEATGTGNGGRVASEETHQCLA